MYGDVRLTAQGDSTEIEWENLSPSEKLALQTLSQKFDLALNGDVGKVLVAKPVAKIEAVLAKAMKRGRKLLSAVVFKNGRIEEIHRTQDGDEVKREPFRDAALTVDPYTMSPVVASEAIVASEPKAAVTVAQPTIGCPIPEFERAEVRATRVLREFLSGQQLADFERTQSFLVMGADSGHKYILTSRHAPAERLDRVGGRSVFDVDAGEAVCVHDWLVPAAEELLELKLFLEMPGRESYVRGLAVGE
jgi:hypothetical protein